MTPSPGQPKKGKSKIVRSQARFSELTKQSWHPCVNVISIEDYAGTVFPCLEALGKTPLTLVEECSRLRELEQDLYARNYRHRYFPGQHNIRIIDTSARNCIYWFIGDIHGDLCALKTAFSFIEAAMTNYPPSVTPVLVFLGDLIDRGPYSREVLDFILDLYENQNYYDILYIKGNHDEGLTILETGYYYSIVLPDDFVQELNCRIEHNEPWHSLPGYAAIRFFNEAATAVVLKTGNKAALCTHGGVPHTDVQELWRKSPHSLETLSKAPKLESLFLKDFTWARFHSSVKKIPPNRNTYNTLLGSNDFEEFCKLFRKKTGLFLSLMVRGHDHVPLGYKEYPNYGQHTLVTITTMCANQVYPDRNPCVGCWYPGEPITVYSLTPPALFLPPEAPST